MLNNILKYNIILGSNSPRRKELLSELEIEFTITKCDKEEIYPKNIKKEKVAEFLAIQKAKNIINSEIKNNYLLITADTIVLVNQKILNKPKNKTEAYKMLSELSENTHQVITGVCIKTITKEIIFSKISEVIFNKLSHEDITHYINKYQPYDKAGSYGIQEWIGHIGIKKINGSYTNIMGLPLSELYEKLKKID